MNSNRAKTAAHRRCDHLHRAFLEVRARQERGERLMQLLRKMNRRFLRAPGIRYSFSSIRRLWHRWVRVPQPETLAHRYKPGLKPRLSASDLAPWIRRLERSPATTVNDVWEAFTRHAPQSKQCTCRTFLRSITRQVSPAWFETRRKYRATSAELRRISAELASMRSTKERQP